MTDNQTNKTLIVFFDSGDTIVEEATEIRNDAGIVVDCKLHAGMKELLRELKNDGFTLALVADGEVDSFKNIYELHGLSDIFTARAVSQAVGIMKPAREMFQTAFDLLKLSEADKKRVVMIGNRYGRDVLGANRYGIKSVLFNWSTRYANERPESQEEMPDFTVSTAEELKKLIYKLDSEVEGELSK